MSPIYRAAHLGRHIDLHSTDMSTDISVDTRPICRLIRWPTVGQYVDRYVGRGVHNIHMIREILMFFLQNIHLEKFSCFSCTVWSSLCFWSSMYLMINSFWKQGRPRLGYIWIEACSIWKVQAASRVSILFLTFLGRSKEGRVINRFKLSKFLNVKFSVTQPTLVLQTSCHYRHITTMDRSYTQKKLQRNV